MGIGIEKRAEMHTADKREIISALGSLHQQGLAGEFRHGIQRKIWEVTKGRKGNWYDFFSVNKALASLTAEGILSKSFPVRKYGRLVPVYSLAIDPDKLPAELTTLSKKREEPAGRFLDEYGQITPSEGGDWLTREFRAANEQKQAMISQAFSEGKITKQYASLLDSIHTSSMSGSITNLEKVKAALELKDKTQPDFSRGKVGYIGSGYDWQFPVALGARRIDMIDEEFDGRLRETLIQDLRDHGIEPSVIPPETAEDFPSILFSIDLGNGVEEVELRLVNRDAEQYSPIELLTGVVEIAGPTKGHIDDSPVFPNIADRLARGAIIANFDFRPVTSISDSLMMKPKRIGDFTVYKFAA